MRAYAFAIPVVCMLAVFAGCATQPARVPSAPVDLHAIEQWQAKGRIGVSGPQGGGSGSFDWQQVSDAADVQIRGPVGIGSVRVQVRGDAQDPELKVQSGDGEILESAAAWSELEARLGAHLPAGNLRFWLLGLAAPGEHRWGEANEAGAVSLDQDGWRIEYQRFSDEFGTRLPVRLRASSGEARVRIVVDRWRLGQ